jgi:pantoate--beta-alanine ligase
VSSIQIISSVIELQKTIMSLKSDHKTIGFVPTMGALHQGHLSLVKSAIAENDVVIVSIFVNPTQFNNPEDLKKYPRMPQQDIELLASISPKIVFLPSAEDIYAQDYDFQKMNLGNLDAVMEGRYRPGHFQGVVNVVNRFFDLVQPDRAYFGKKDFQQVAVIKFMTKVLHPKITICEGETLRDENGLALSSRNMLLSNAQKHDALALFMALSDAKKLAGCVTPHLLKNQIAQRFDNSTLRLEYFEIVDPNTLEPLTNEWLPGATACIAAYCGAVRLIDNLELIPASGE